eukprot:scaffold155788_cov35-Tisochrysis_lutea.AAC.2
MSSCACCHINIDRVHGHNCNLFFLHRHGVPSVSSSDRGDALFLAATVPGVSLIPRYDEVPPRACICL